MNAILQEASSADTVASGAQTASGDKSLHQVLNDLQREFAERAAEFDQTGEFPHENFASLQAHGLLSLAVPAEYGGAQASLATLAQVIRSVALGDPSTALVLVMQYIFHDLVARSTTWPDHLRERIFQDAVTQGALINGLRVEPELGTPARGGLPATVARPTPEGWRINGRKIYSTGAPGLTWMIVWARSEEDPVRVGGWLVRSDSPNVQIVPAWNHLGMRATGSHEVVFDNLLVPHEHALDIRAVDQSPARLDARFSHWNTVLIATVYDAVARSARDWFANWLHERRPANLGASLATLPRFQEALGEMNALLYANHALLELATQKVPTPVDLGLLKYVTSQNSIRTVERAIELTGNPGLSRDNPLQRFYRDVLCSRVHTPQNDTILGAAGRAALESVKPRKSN